MKLIKVKNEKEYILRVLEIVKDDLLVIPTKENKTILICENLIFEIINDFVEVISINDLTKYNRRDLIKYIKENNLPLLWRSDFIQSFLY